MGGGSEERVDCAVIGAGVVGLAVARSLALAGRGVVVLDAGGAVGTGASSRNSEIIHAGMYYRPGSLKAELCREGRRLLYDYCRERGVDYCAAGKLIVATGEAEVPVLERLAATGEANGAPGLRMLGAHEAVELEPALRCVAALHSPWTGVVDSAGLMRSFQRDAESRGAEVRLRTLVTGGAATPEGVRLETAAAEQPQEGTEETSEGLTAGTPLLASMVVNAAGLDATLVAARIAGLDSRSIPRRHLAKGCYFELDPAAPNPNPFSRLVYPVPEDGGLGVHVTLDLGGRVRFGPDVEWLPAVADSVVPRYDYTIDPRRADSFYTRIRKYYPDLPDGALRPAYAGIRVKLSAPGDGPADFVIQSEAEHGVHGLVNLYGFESPGLTSCLATAEAVRRALLSTPSSIPARL
eukprot:SM000185S04019  [mRNA]  locus=s185:44344:47028:+ [translate_table: standard]